MYHTQAIIFSFLTLVTRYGILINLIFYHLQKSKILFPYDFLRLKLSLFISNLKPSVVQDPHPPVPLEFLPLLYRV